jgi:ATP-binding cassette subfamily B protein
VRISRLYPYLRRHRAAFVVGVTAIVIGDLLLLSAPWWLRKAIDALEAGNLRDSRDAALLMLGVTAAGGVFKFVMRRWMIGASRWMELEIRRDFTAHVFRLSPSFFDRHKVGDLMALATNDLNAIRMLLGPGIMYVVNTLVTLTVALALMATLSPVLTLVALLPLPLLAFAVQQGSRLTYTRYAKVQEQFGTVNSFAQEALTGVRTIKAYVREDGLAERFSEQAQTYVDLNIRFIRVQAAMHPVMTMIAGFAAAGVLFFGGRMVIAGSISIGTLVAFLAYSAALTWPTIALGWTVNLWQRGLASLDRVGKVLDVVPAVPVPRDPVAWPREERRGEVVFDDVTFRYPDHDHPAADKISFRCRPGTWTAIVGPTGGGKTTLLRLLARQYDEYGGRISIDGIDLRKIDPADLRAGTGYAPQDGYLFSDTLRENISFGAPDLTDRELEELARVSRLERDRDNFPQGWETPVGERGVTLSGGQKQRVGIARALAAHPALLLFDDVFSSVDTETEAELTAELREAWADRTVLLVTHRLLSLADADHILVVDAGRIVESGRHDDLVAMGGLYARLHAEQATEAKLDALDPEALA